MKEIKVYLNDIIVVKNFVKDISNLDCHIDVVNDKYIVDAKSIMGIFSLDLSNPVTIKIHEPTKEIIKVIEKYKV